MAIYELDGQAPDLPADGNYFIAETATVIAGFWSMMSGTFFLMTLRAAGLLA